MGSGFVDKARRRLQRSPMRHIVTMWRHRGIEPTDVFLSSYPKSGMTWLRNMLAAFFVDTTDGWMDDIRRVSNYVGRHQRLESFLPSGGRLIKTHESCRSKYGKAITLFRDGRDVAVSEFNYMKRYLRAVDFSELDFSAFLDLYLEGQVHGYGAWPQHVSSWLDHSACGGGPTLAVKYEDLKRGPCEELARIVGFLGVDVDISRVERAVQASSIDRMRTAEAKSVGGNEVSFVRRGVVGGWRSVFSQRDEERFWEVAGDSMESLGYARCDSREAS